MPWSSGPVGTMPIASQVTMVNVEADGGKKKAIAGGLKDGGAGLAKGARSLDVPTEQPASILG